MREWLIRIRVSQELSQFQAARLSGISQSYYAAIERGTRGKPLSVTIAKKIAEALGFEWIKFFE